MRQLKNATNVDGPSTDYPKGRTRTKTGSVAGTISNEFLNGDLQQLLQKLIIDASISENDLPDNVTNGYQLLDALVDKINKTRSFVIQNSTNVFTITSPSGATVIAYKQLSQSGKTYTLQTEFTVSTGGVTDPVFNFNIATPNVVIGSQVIGWDDQNGFGFYEITGATPLQITMRNGIASGTRTIKLPISFVTT